MARAATAEEAQEVHEKPPASTEKLDPNDPFKSLKGGRIETAKWWETVSAVPETAWGRYKVYLYRLWPKIDRKLSNPSNPNNIATFEAPFDEGFLLRNHGSGKYELQLADLGRPENFRRVCRTVLDLQNADYPPVIELRELDLGYDGNRSYIAGLRMRGLLPGENVSQHTSGDVQAVIGVLREVLQHIQKTSQPNSTEGQAIGKVIDYMSTAYKATMENSLASLKHDDPEKFTKFVAAIKDLQGTANQGGSLRESLGTIKEIIALARPADQPSVLSQLKELKDLAGLGGPPPNGLGQVRDLLGVMKEAKELFGAGIGSEGAAGPGGGKWEFWGEVIRQGAPALRDMVHEGVEAWRQWLWMKGGGQPGGWPAQPASQPVAATPAALPAPAAQSAAQAARSAPSPAGVSQPVGQPDPRLQVLQQVAVPFMGFLTSGRQGDDFAGHVEDGWGALAYDQLASFGEEGLLEVLKTSPLWPQLAPLEAKVRVFLQQFLAFGQQPDGPPDGQPDRVNHFDEEPPDEPPEEPRKRARKGPKS